MSEDRRHMSFGVALERIGIWAIVVGIGWFGSKVERLSNEVASLREQNAASSAERKSESARVDRLEKDMKRVDGEVDGICDTMQWALTTFHGTKVPKAKRHDN